MEEPLYVCKNCLYAWNYKGYRSLPQQSEQQNQAVRDFNIKEFFANCKPLFRSLPLRTGKTKLLGDDYDRNWPYITNAYRACKGWCCERCGVDLSDRTHLLHTHHINGVKHDICFSNLMALCVLCHYEQPNHEWIKNLPVFSEAPSFIPQKRREMGIKFKSNGEKQKFFYDSQLELFS